VTEITTVELPDLDRLQLMLAEFQTSNFPPCDDADLHSLLMAALCGEELGEIDHALVKSIMGIRGNEDHAATLKDAAGDLLRALCQLCTALGFRLSDGLRTAWEEVQERNFLKNSETGRND
jgi:NTP pyrophosphatase (non-canonical NTP hydrolase)